MTCATIEAQPAPVAMDTGKCALLIIDVQRDFLEPGGFGEALGNDPSCAGSWTRSASCSVRPVMRG